MLRMTSPTSEAVTRLTPGCSKEDQDRSSLSILLQRIFRRQIDASHLRLQHGELTHFLQGSLRGSASLCKIDAAHMHELLLNSHKDTAKLERS